MKCSFRGGGGCDNEAIESSNRCEKHPFRKPTDKYPGRSKTQRMSKDRKRSVCPNGPVVVVRDVYSNFVDRLAEAVGYDHASAIVDALDAYLEAVDRFPVLPWLPPSPNAELDKIRKERDEAVARAEKAEQELKKKRGK